MSWDPGPNLKQPGWLRCKISILGYAWRHHSIQIFIMSLAMLVIFVFILKWDELRPPMHTPISIQMITEIVQDVLHSLLFSPMFFQEGVNASSESPSTWVDWWVYVQSLLGGGTLLVALFVWYGEIREEWTASLPKRMSVFFLRKGMPVIICRYVWLAGEGDLRAWGQQVAGQAVPSRAAKQVYLRFYPNIKAEVPSFAVWIDGKICRHYVVCFELTEDNPVLKKYIGMCRYQNMATGKNDVRSVPLPDLQKEVPASVFPFKWPEHPIENQNQTTLMRFGKI